MSLQMPSCIPTHQLRRKGRAAEDHSTPGCTIRNATHTQRASLKTFVDPCGTRVGTARGRTSSGRGAP
eukprot:28221-Eustigmatos_ZCMA.PRE.1